MFANVIFFISHIVSDPTVDGSNEHSTSWQEEIKRKERNAPDFRWDDLLNICLFVRSKTLVHVKRQYVYPNSDEWYASTF